MVRERRTVDGGAIQIRCARVGIAVGCERLRPELIAQNPQYVGARIARGFGYVLPRRLPSILLRHALESIQRGQGGRLEK